MDIRLFGRSLLQKKPKKKRKQEKKATDQSEKAKATDRDKQAKVMDQEISSKQETSDMQSLEIVSLVGQMSESDGDASNTLMIKDEKDACQDDAQKDEHDMEERRSSGIIQRIRSIFTGIAQIPAKIWQKLCSISDSVRHLSERKERLEATIDRYLDFWHRTCTQTAKDHILKEVKYLLRHILPKKAEGTLTFGFEDPATTGQVLGILCILAIFTGNHLEANGNFEGPVLEGDVELKGHIRLCHIAKTAVSLLADKNIRKTIRDGRKLVGG